MKNILSCIILCFCAGLLITACHQSSSSKMAKHNKAWMDSLKTLNEKKPVREMETIGSADISGEAINLMSYKKPFAGYDHFYLSVGDSNIWKNAKVSVTARGSKNQAVMVEEISRDSLYKGDLPVQVLFPEKGTYTLNIRLNGKQANIPILVKDEKGLLKKVKLNDGTQLLLALDKPQFPAKGFNELELGLYKQDKQRLEPVNDYSFMIEPFMPSMGHGSHYNINPVNTGNGLYKGRVNLMMEGQWLVKVKLLRHKKMIDSTLNFNFNF